MVPRLLTVAAALVVTLHAQNVGTTRTRIFISDLHLGVGRSADGVWSPFEDFRWNAEFKAFLTSLQSDEGVDLVLVGDSFELWQSLEKDCRSTNPDLGCTEGEALHRIERVLQQHQDTIAALGAFARSGSNHVFLVPGNHDAGPAYMFVAR
jgi:UDP-2,3-diacylglucosamine pyrophosphatase LpxH